VTVLLSCDPPRFVRMTAEEYHADPCDTPSLSSSCAHKIVAYSPAHAYSRHPRLGGKAGKSTKATDGGSLIHSLMLDGGKGICEIYFDNFQTKAAQKDRDAAIVRGEVPVLSKDIEEGRRTAEILKVRLAEQGMVFDGETELVALWTETAEDGTRVPCRGMIDHFSRARAMVDDLKTSRSASLEKLPRHMTDYGYDIQAAAYTSAVQKIHPELLGRVQFAFGFCELEDPYAVTVIERGNSGSMYELGEMRWRRAINTFARCLNTGRWPAYATKRVRLDAPTYVLQREMDLQAYGDTDAHDHVIEERDAPRVKPIEDEDYGDDAGLF
jgi:hypothetical protein